MPVTDDSAILRKILREDPAWCAFALADLAPPYSEYARWHLAADGRALLLEYGGLDTPVLFAHGRAADLVALLAEVGRREFYINVKLEFADALRSSGWEIRPELRMWRMVLDAARFAAADRSAERLGAGDYERLKELYRDGDAAGEAPPFFNPGMLQHGIYYGVRDGEAIIAAAGTPVLSLAESVAAIGTVYTMRSYRGRGSGRQVTAAVTAELLNLGIRLIALNVVESNTAAIRVYDRLGFQCYCEYREGRARRQAERQS